MSRDEMLELLLELESAAEAYNAGYSSARLAKAIAWLEDESNKVDLVKKVENGWNYSCNEFQVDGWLLTSTE